MWKAICGLRAATNFRWLEGSKLVVARKGADPPKSNVFKRHEIVDTAHKEAQSTVTFEHLKPSIL